MQDLKCDLCMRFASASHTNTLRIMRCGSRMHFECFFNFSVQFGGVVGTEARFGWSAGVRATVHAIASVLVQSDNKFTVELIRFRLLTNGTTDRCTIAVVSHARALTYPMPNGSNDILLVVVFFLVVSSSATLNCFT